MLRFSQLHLTDFALLLHEEHDHRFSGGPATEGAFFRDEGDRWHPHDRHARDLIARCRELDAWASLRLHYELVDLLLDGNGWGIGSTRTNEAFLARRSALMRPIFDFLQLHPHVPLTVSAEDLLYTILFTYATECDEAAI